MLVIFFLEKPKLMDNQINIHVLCPCGLHLIVYFMDHYISFMMYGQNVILNEFLNERWSIARSLNNIKLFFFFWFESLC